MEELIKLGKTQLTDIQLDVLNDCLNKKSGGLSLPMGFGKSIISLVCSLEQTKDNNRPILIVMSKTLIESWIHEIKKFFNDNLKYIVFHPEYLKKINEFIMKDDIKVFLTTPDVISKYYKQENISDLFVRQRIENEGLFGQHFVNEYNRPSITFSNINTGGAILYSTEWGCLIVDEVQNFTKITTFKCQGIASLFAYNRWALSGTIFNEPVLERILGYYLIIDDEKFPRSLPDAKKYLSSPYFKGTTESLVLRKTNPSFIKPKINQFIVSHKLSEEEEKLYMSMKNIIGLIQKKVREFKFLGDTVNSRKFSTYLLAMITYLRQCIVCSIIPISSIAIDMSEFKGRSELSKMLNDEIEKLNLKKWLDNVDSVRSTRFKKAIEIIDKHVYENIVVFTCFRTCLEVFQTFLPEDRNIYTISSNMTAKKRSNTLEEFGKPNKNGLGNILLLTYDIGAEGLNLQQISNTVLLLDFFWNDGKTSQAVARVLRYGQKSEEVNIYYMSSNSAIENAIFEKQNLKLQIINELETGKQKTTIKKMRVQDIIKIIHVEDNINFIKKINIRR